MICFDHDETIAAKKKNAVIAVIVCVVFVPFSCRYPRSKRRAGAARALRALPGRPRRHMVLGGWFAGSPRRREYLKQRGHILSCGSTDMHAQCIANR